MTAIAKPRSQWTVMGGKSLSRVTDEELLATAKKAGWTKDDTTVTDAHRRPVRSRARFPIEKGKMKGTVKIVRPTAAPGSARQRVSGFAAAVHDARRVDERRTPPLTRMIADADVFVGVDLDRSSGKAADAKKILDTLVVKGEAQPDRNGSWHRAPPAAPTTRPMA